MHSEVVAFKFYSLMFFLLFNNDILLNLHSLPCFLKVIVSNNLFSILHNDSFCNSSKKAEKNFDIHTCWCVPCGQVYTSIKKAIFIHHKSLAGSQRKWARSEVVVQVNIDSKQPVDENSWCAKLVSVTSLCGQKGKPFGIIGKQRTVFICLGSQSNL